MSRRRRAAFHEPSLVPLADMLCNTVGVIVFILIFTVLTAGGALLMKRLPYEHTTKLKRAIFVCYHDRVLPMDEQGLHAEFEKGLPKSELTFDNLDRYVAAINKRKVENKYFKLTMEAEVQTEDYGFYLRKRLSVSSSYHPKDNAGELIQDFDNSHSVYRAALHADNPKKRFVYFLVYPDSLEVFDKARTIAREMSYETGWFGNEANKPLEFSSNGRDSTAQ